MRPAPNTLLDAWHAVADRRRADAAVVCAGTGRRWSFEELRTSARSPGAPRPGGGSPGVTVVRSQGIQFILDLLAAWETGDLVCPLESDAPAPPPEQWHGLRAAFPEAVLAKSTSGSTGTPRLILFSADQLAADANAIVSTMGLRPDVPNVAAISLAHSYGFSNLVLPLLLHGIPLVIAASPLPESLRTAFACIQRGTAGGTRATLPGVPALWRAWLAAGAIDGPHLALALSAGAPLPLELEHHAWTTTGIKIHNFLGSSECGGIAYDRSAVPRLEATLAGTPLDGVQLSTDPAGRLVVHSPAVALGYWPPEEAASSRDSLALQPGVFRSGDLAEHRADGWHLLGREADTINLAGRKIHPSEIETILRRHPDVRECLVFGVPSAEAVRSEEIVAVIALPPTREAAAAGLPAWLGNQVPPWQQPRHWWFEPNLAVTARGKLPRAEWRARFLARHRNPETANSHGQPPPD